MNRRGYLRIIGTGIVGTTIISSNKTVSATDGSDTAGDQSGPNRSTKSYAPTGGKSSDLVSSTQTSTSSDQVVLSGQLTGNYDPTVGKIRIGPPGDSDNITANILSSGSFSVDVPTGESLDVAYVQEDPEDSNSFVTLNGNPDVYYIRRIDGISADRDLGTIDIPAGNQLDVKFEDANGEPLDNIRVGVRSLSTEADRWWQISVPTNSNGFYQIGNSPTGIEVAGGVEVVVFGDNADERVPDANAIPGQFTITEPRFETFVVDPITISGNVVRPNNAPASSGIMNIFVDPNRFAEQDTDGEGRFNIQVPQNAEFGRGAYEVQYYKSGLLDSASLRTDGDWVDMYAGPQLDGTVDQNVGTIELPEGDLVEVEVNDESGEPVENATVEYRDRNSTLKTTAAFFLRTDEAGLASLSEEQSGLRLSGDVLILASPPADSEQFADTTVEQEITVTEPTTVDITLPLTEDADPQPPDGEVTLAIEPSTSQVTLDGETALDIVVTGPDAGVGAYDFTASINDPAVASFTSIEETRTGGTGSTSIGPDGTTVTADRALLSDSFVSSETVTLATTIVSGETVGTTELQIDTATVGNEDGTEYTISGTQSATVEVTEGIDVTGNGNPATDPDGDGVFEDVNGDGSADVLDVQALFTNLGSESVEGSSAFDVNGDGSVDVLDVQALFTQL